MAQWGGELDVSISRIDHGGPAGRRREGEKIERYTDNVLAQAVMRCTLVLCLEGGLSYYATMRRFSPASRSTRRQLTQGGVPGSQDEPFDRAQGEAILKPLYEPSRANFPDLTNNLATRPACASDRLLPSPGQHSTTAGCTPHYGPAPGPGRLGWADLTRLEAGPGTGRRGISRGHGRVWEAGDASPASSWSCLVLL